MFLAEEFRGRGEWPERPKNGPDIASSKGYPAKRDPQAENPQGVMRRYLGEASIHKMRQRYSACKNG